MLFPTGKCIFFWGGEISLVQDNGPSLALNFECFSSKGQSDSYSKSRVLTFHLWKSEEAREVLRLFFFLSPSCIYPPESALLSPALWSGFLVSGSRIVLLSSFTMTHKQCSGLPDESKVKPGRSTWGTAAPDFSCP